MTTTAAPASLKPSHLIDAEGVLIDDVSREDIESRLASKTYFWLDLPTVGDEESTWLRDVFAYHPLAVQNCEKFGQRPKVEEYDNYTLLVMYGSQCEPEESAGSRIEVLSEVSEVHFFVAAHSIVTVHRSGCPAFASLRDRLRAFHAAGVHHESKVMYLVADTLVDSFLPAFDALDERIDALQDQVMQRPTNEQLSELLDHKRSLIGLRRVLAPQRDMFASVAAGVVDLPGSDKDSERYLRDVYDHLIRLTDLLDGYRDLLSGTTDAYLSVVSNQLNVVMKQLSIIATVFLPLSFLTGFFGQNFSWLTGHLGGVGVFVGLGLGTELVAVVALIALFRKRGWLGKSRPPAAT